jgi:DNA-binding beta-propeller fold protein YncE
MITLAGLLAGAAPALVALALVALALVAPALGAPDPSVGAPRQDAEPLAFRLTATLPLGPPDRWDYLAYDDTTQRLFVAHGTELTVISTSNPLSAHRHADSMTIVGRVGGLDGAHGVVLVPGGLGYVASGRTGTVVAFDLATLKPVRKIAVGAGPDALAYDPSSRNLFVMNGEAGKITVVSTQSGAVAASIATGGTLEFAAADGQGNLYVDQVDTDSLLRIDTNQNSVLARWKLDGCHQPTGLAVDQWSHHLFVSCANARLLVVNGLSGHVLAQVPIGYGSDAVAYDSNRHLVFSSNGDGTLSAMSAVSFQALTPAPTAPGARTMALDPVSGRIFTVAADVTGPVAERDADGWPRLTFTPGTVKLLVYSPAF